MVMYCFLPYLVLPTGIAICPASPSDSSSPIPPHTPHASGANHKLTHSGAGCDSTSTSAPATLHHTPHGPWPYSTAQAFLLALQPAGEAVLADLRSRGAADACAWMRRCGIAAELEGRVGLHGERWLRGMAHGGVDGSHVEGAGGPVAAEPASPALHPPAHAGQVPLQADAVTGADVGDDGKLGASALQQGMPLLVGAAEGTPLNQAIPTSTADMGQQQGQEQVQQPPMSLQDVMALELHEIVGLQATAAAAAGSGHGRARQALGGTEPRVGGGAAAAASAGSGRHQYHPRVLPTSSSSPAAVLSVPAALAAAACVSTATPSCTPHGTNTTAAAAVAAAVWHADPHPAFQLPASVSMGVMRMAHLLLCGAETGRQQQQQRGGAGPRKSASARY